MATNQPAPVDTGLEGALIEEFLAGAGFTRESLQRLPPDAQRAVMRSAAAFATLRLTEIAARARYIHEICGG